MRSESFPRAAALLSSAGLAAWLAGCAASAPAPVLLSLPHAMPHAMPHAAPQPADAPAASASAVQASPTLVVRRVEIPEYMSSRRVRYRADASTLAEWPNTFWAERIEIGVTREFVSALRSRLPGWTVCDGTCDDRAPTLALQVDVSTLDYLRTTQQLEARARVAVTNGRGEATLLQVREQSFSLKGADDSAQSEAQAVTQLLRDVAALAAPAVLAAVP